VLAAAGFRVVAGRSTITITSHVQGGERMIRWFIKLMLNRVRRRAGCSASGSGAEMNLVRVCATTRGGLTASATSRAERTSSADGKIRPRRGANISEGA